MKSMILVALALVAVAAAAPAADQAPVLILRSNYDQQPEGGYQFGFEAENGIAREETGEVKEVPDEENKPHKVVIVRGSYSYPSADGSGPVTIVYYADETGYHADGESIPKVASR